MVKSIHLEEGQVMRALFTTTAGSGHFHPLVPLAQAARSAGYEVAFACPRSLCPRIEALGFLAIAAGRDGDEDPEMQQALASLPRYLEHSPMEANRYMLAVVFGRINGRLMTPDLLHTCQRWRPDVLVREAYEFGAVLVADYLDLPHAAVLVDPNTVWPAPLSDALAVQLDALRQVYGLSPDPTLQSLYRYLSFSFEPPGYRTPGTPVPPTLHHLHAPVFDRIGGEEVPDWLADLAGNADRPMVYVTLGTVFNKTPGILEMVVRALRDEPLSLVVTVGPDRDPAELGPQPAHVRVARYVPQSLLLPHCHLVVCHGGHNTVLGALGAGLPVVIIPFAADQPENGRRCAALGVGRTIAPEALNPEVLRTAVRDVLHEPSYRVNAVRLRAEMAALPGLEYAVELLERLIRERVPQRTA